MFKTGKKIKADGLINTVPVTPRPYPPKGQCAVKDVNV